MITLYKKLCVCGKFCYFFNGVSFSDKFDIDGIMQDLIKNFSSIKFLNFLHFFFECEDEETMFLLTYVSEKCKLKHIHIDTTGGKNGPCLCS